ncbi:MAG: LacI family DNA-binding transcriptional regulator, partial [Spirochaetota bacterium]
MVAGRSNPAGPPWPRDAAASSRPPTIRAIAEAAGVSRGTVDRALNDRGDVKVAVAERIRTIAAELGYVPNKAAKALRFNHTPRTIAVLLPETGSGFFDQVAAGVARATSDLAGMGIHTRAIRFDPRSQDAVVGAIRGLLPSAAGPAAGSAAADAVAAIDAAVITGPDTPAVRQAVCELIDAGVPVVTYNSDIDVAGRLAFVGQDLRKSGLVAAELMAKITPRAGRVVAVTGNLSFQAHRDRIVGFEDGISRWAPHLAVDVREGFDAYETTREAVAAAFAGGEVVGVYMATGSIEAALEVVRERSGDGGQAAPPGGSGVRRGGRRVRVITNDALPVVVAGIEAGEIDFSILQDPAHQGSEPVRMLAE